MKQPDESLKSTTKHPQGCRCKKSKERGYLMNIKKQQIKSTEKWLDERYEIVIADNRTADKAYYDGALETIRFLGFWWQRDEEGKHIIY